MVYYTPPESTDASNPAATRSFAGASCAVLIHLAQSTPHWKFCFMSISSLVNMASRSWGAMALKTARRVGISYGRISHTRFENAYLVKAV